MLPEGLGAGDALPLILVGEGKTLLLRNVRIVHAGSLAACLQLSAGARRPAHCRTTLAVVRALGGVGALLSQCLLRQNGTAARRLPQHVLLCKLGRGRQKDECTDGCEAGCACGRVS